ncbi:hypothetical protein ES707_20750 [subsurface metagenome]
MKIAVDELKKKDLTLLLTNLQQKILDCYKLEEKAFQKLDYLIK